MTAIPSAAASSIRPQRVDAAMVSPRPGGQGAALGARHQAVETGLPVPVGIVGGQGGPVERGGDVAAFQHGPDHLVVEVAPAAVAVQDDRKGPVARRYPQAQREADLAARDARPDLVDVIGDLPLRPDKVGRAPDHLHAVGRRRHAAVLVREDHAGQLPPAARPGRRGDLRPVVEPQRIGRQGRRYRIELTHAMPNPNPGLPANGTPRPRRCIGSTASRLRVRLRFALRCSISTCASALRPVRSSSFARAKGA